MTHFAVYERKTGRIVQTGTAARDEDAVLQGSHDPELGVTLIECNEHADYVVDTVHGIVGPRPWLEQQPKTQVKANGKDTIKWRKIPLGTEVFIDRVSQGIIDDGELVFATTMPATYRIRLEPPFPTVPEIWSIEAYAP